MAADPNSYEELRRQRVKQNLKHLEELGISRISKSLLEVAKCEHKLLKPRASPKMKKNFGKMEIRRSSRARNLVPSYRDQVDDIELRSHRRRYCKSEQRGRVYTGRIASYEEQHRAVEKAEELQSNLDPIYPSFIKSMVRSHVSSCFWLGLPTRFCKEHLPPYELKMVLEDENGNEFDAIYIGNRTGLSGGWRGFAMEHNLEDGDVLVFELREPARFKIYIIKAIDSEAHEDKITNRHTEGTESQGTEESPEQLLASQSLKTRSGSRRKPAKTKKSAYS
ncbi:B3 domain-containing protein Os05g0481400 isoform X1 [Musa acuminata AAA Group]|uniref:B3 domain-containing protein Os05g0481400 isoform X1 n=1 Tax=Musa acuminata AAA Group TaxID=214697 RepID=UPI0031CFDBA5